MALDLQPPDGRKRVKVYELRDNDWFDRGTGFCTGSILDVRPFAIPCHHPQFSFQSTCLVLHFTSSDYIPVPLRLCAQRRAMSSLLSSLGRMRSSHRTTLLTNTCSLPTAKLTPCACYFRKPPEYSSNPKMNPIVSCWKPRSSRTMAIKNSKVSIPLHPAQLVLPTMKHILTDWYHAIRDFDSLDRTQRHRYGAEFPRGRGMRGYLVRRLFAVCVARTYPNMD